MIYLKDNPLLREPLDPEHIKNRLLGHWGSDPGLSFIYTHLNRLIKKHDLDMIFLAGPGHGAPGVLSQRLSRRDLLGGLSRQERGRRGHAALLQAVLLPRRHRQPLHARDARLDPRRRRAGLLALARLRRGVRQPRPDRRRVVGDGEAETGPLATAWHSNKFLNPIRDGAVLPILHLNGYKINNPTILARISRTRSWRRCSRGYGYTPYFVEGSEPESMHQAMAATLEHCVDEIRAIQEEARADGRRDRARAGR